MTPRQSFIAKKADNREPACYWLKMAETQKCFFKKAIRTHQKHKSNQRYQRELLSYSWWGWGWHCKTVSTGHLQMISVIIKHWFSFRIIKYFWILIFIWQIPQAQSLCTFWSVRFIVHAIVQSCFCFCYCNLSLSWVAEGTALIINHKCWFAL